MKKGWTAAGVLAGVSGALVVVLVCVVDGTRFARRGSDRVAALAIDALRGEVSRTRAVPDIDEDLVRADLADPAVGSVMHEVLAGIGLQTAARWRVARDLEFVLAGLRREWRLESDDESSSRHALLVARGDVVFGALRVLGALLRTGAVRVAAYPDVQSSPGGSCRYDPRADRVVVDVFGRDAHLEITIGAVGIDDRFELLRETGCVLLEALGQHGRQADFESSRRLRSSTTR